MNLSEVELVLKDLVKEVQETKALMEKAEAPKEQNEISDSLSYSLRILPKKIDRLHLLMDLLVKKQGKDSGGEMSKLSGDLQQSLERHIHQLKNPVAQRIRHEHSYKDWKWLVLLFFFVGLSLLLGWYCLNNYNRYKELRVKYGYIQKVTPDFVRSVDSVYNTNPSFLQEDHQIAQEERKRPEPSSKKKRSRKKAR